MVISRNTTLRTLQVICLWAEEQKIPKTKVAELLDRLAEVPGNKSFRDSIEELKESIARELLPSEPL